MSSNFNFYPYPDDPDFNEKIYRKKEFYINKTKKVDTTKEISELMEEKCSGFKLSDNQKFLKTFMSNNTPYNGILLFHGTGVGKTCSSISIAEQYTEVLEKYNKKVIILLNPSIEDNFRKNIFNPGSIKTKKVTQQCIGDKYLKKIKTYKTTDFTRDDLSDKEIDDVTKKVDNRIKAQYRFQGYRGFTNKLTDLKQKLEKRPGAYEKRVKEFFSNSVLIIDEVHNIKNTKEPKKQGSIDDESSVREGAKINPEGKKFLKILNEVLEHADEIKLILLSATPMFNEPQEIVFLLNILLKNDKRKEINTSDVFNSDGSLTEDGARILQEKSRGIVSYLRGENPLAFPMRLEPYETKENPVVIKPAQLPKLDYKGEELPESKRLKHLKIIPCVMKDGSYQREIYDKIKETGFGSFENEGISVSNIVFPGSSDENYQDRISNKGFFKNFKKSVTAGKVKITPTNDAAIEMLKISEIGKYSTKMRTILKSITETKTEGIVFVYSRYVWQGVVMLGLLLEMEGFTNNNGNLLKGDYGQGKRGDKAKYMIISGDMELSRNNYINYIKKEARNKDGSKLKVILGSESASEGLDFKYIREVHVLDPWHHLNKIEQVIGRGIRYCSHIDLPVDQRNVTVFMYAATLSKDPSKDNETVDLKVYRDAENKDKQMADITYILKQNAVDCNLNINNNKFTDDYFKDSKVTMIDSKNNKRNVNYRDTDNTRLCNYRDCDFKCSPDLHPNRDLKPSEIDTDTFDATLVVENINQVIEIIKSLFTVDSVLELTEVAKDANITKMNIDMDFVQLCLDTMVQKEILLRDKFDNVGEILSRGKYYIFAPSYLKSDKISLHEISRPLRVVENKIDLTSDLDKLRLAREVILKDHRENIKISDVKDLIEELDLQENRLHYLPNNIKELILKYLIRIKLDKTDELYKRYYEDENLRLPLNILYRNDTVDYIKKSKTNGIYGYFLVEGKTLRVMELNESGDSFTEAKGDNKKAVINYLRRTMEKEKKGASIIAYMEMKKNDIVLKVQDKVGESGKSKKSQSSGIVLTSQGMSKSSLNDYIEQLLRAQKFHKDKKNYKKDLASLLKHFPEIKEKLGNVSEKSDLYTIVEDLFLENNKKKIQDSRWFFTLEEKYILDLIKK